MSPKPLAPEKPSCLPSVARQSYPLALLLRKPAPGGFEVEERRRPGGNWPQDTGATTYLGCLFRRFTRKVRATALSARLFLRGCAGALTHRGSRPAARYCRAAKDREEDHPFHRLALPTNSSSQAAARSARIARGRRPVPAAKH